VIKVFYSSYFLGFIYSRKTDWILYLPVMNFAHSEGRQGGFKVMRMSLTMMTYSIGCKMAEYNSLHFYDGLFAVTGI
jgi:hypothetical protein